MNMFFAVMNRNFQEIMEKEEEHEKDTVKIKSDVSFMQHIRQKLTSMTSKSTKHHHKSSEDDAGHDHKPGENGAETDQEYDDHQRARASSASFIGENGHADSMLPDSADSPQKKASMAELIADGSPGAKSEVIKQDITKDMVKDPNWHHL